MARPLPAQAAAGDHGAGLGFGEILLMGDFQKYFDSGLGYQLTYSYEASQLFGLLAHVSYSSHSNGTGTNSLTILGITPDLRVNLAYIDKLVAYSVVGLGLFKVSETLGQTKGSVTTMGFDLGAGLSLALDKHFQFGPEITFRNIFGRTDSATATASAPGINIGGTYIGMMLNLLYVF